MVSLDSVDVELVRLLERDARQSSQLIAKQLNVSPSTVRRRLRKLINNGVVHISAIVDANKLGFPLVAVMALDVAHERLDLVTQWLADREEVRWVSTMTGRFDVMAMAQFRSTDELSEFIQTQLARLEGVKNSETFICLHVQKRFGLPL